MPFDRPTLPDLIAQAQADIAARLPGADARAPRSILSVLARVEAGGLHGLYGYLDWLSEQLLPDQATDWLDRHGAVWGILRKQASAATGEVTLKGSGLVPAGTVLRTAGGRRYVTLAEVVVSGPTTVEVEAEEAGAASNAVADTVLSLVTPIAGIESQATVADAGIGGGADIEADDALRARLLARIQQPPHGGAAHDYVAWALEVEGVTRAWVSPHEMGAGSVTVRIMSDGLTPDGIPAAATVEAAQAHIDGLRPVTAEVHVVPPVAVPLALTISDLQPATAEVRAAVEAEIADLVARQAVPGGTILVSHLRAAISAAAGEVDHVLVSPLADITHAAYEIAVPGPVTWA